MPTATSSIRQTGANSSRVTGTSVRGAPGQEVYGLLLTAFSVLLLLSLVSFDARDVALHHQLRSGDVHNLIGPVGAHIGDLMFRTVGLGAFFMCSTFFYFGGLLLAGRRPRVDGHRVVAWLLTLVFCAVLFHLILSSFRPFAHLPGGGTGAWVGEILRSLFATTGTLIIAIGALSASILILSGLPIVKAAAMPAKGVRWVARQMRAPRLSGGGEGEALLNPEADPTPARPEKMPVDRPDWLPEQPSAPPAGPQNDVLPRIDEERKPAPTPKAAPPSPVPPKADPPAPEKKADPPASEKKADPPAPEKKVEPAPPKLAEPLISAPAAVEIAVRADAGPLPMVADQPALPLDPETRPFEFPSLSLLHYEAPSTRGIDTELLKEAARTLEAKLADFGVKGQVVKIQPGPVVTMYEYQPAAGVKISKIANLADDLTMALEAQRVRIVAPIPGKGVVGIEVPSAVRETVYLKEILAAKEFQEARGKLPIALGKDIVGHPVVADLAKMPHLLVAGSTGSGKSVAINTFLCSLIYRQRPEDLRLILVDPKMLELSIYDDIPHLLLPVVTQAAKASLALKWAVSEMERRYRLLAACNVRNIAGFNTKVLKYKSGEKESPDGVGPDELEHLPYIVIILDELADLMMVAGKDVEQSIARLAQMARAAGIHLVVATQRPSVDVVTGLIKANFPTRMSFMVSQKVDSRTILDRSGAELLLGMGDMLYMPPGSSKLTRVQGCFVSDDEVERITDHCKQWGPPEYDMAILADDDENKKDLSGEDYDALFDQAVAIVTDTGNPSISYLQRRLKVGYNRSARMVERMEFDGVISAADHRGVRKVLVSAMPEDE